MNKKYYKLVSENGNVILISLVDIEYLENIKKNAKSCEEITKEEFESEGEYSTYDEK